MAQLKDLIVNGASRFIGDIFGTNATLSGNVMPQTDNTQSLGDSTHRWKLYGTITGSLDKTFKIKLNNTQYTYDGSANVDLSTIYTPTTGGTVDTQALVSGGATTAPNWVDISPSVTITDGDASDAPKINVTTLGQSGTAQSLTKATTGVYGVTKLTNAYTSTDETLATTGKSILAAIQTLDVTAITGAVNKTITSISETDGKISATYSDIGSLDASAITTGKLALAKGGTNSSSYRFNSVIVGSSTQIPGTENAEQLVWVQSKSGALYSAGTDQPTQFGTLPVAQGGTGATTAANARTNLGALGSKLVGNYEGMTTMSGDDTKWIRTTTAGIIPYESGGAGSGHSSLGTSSWRFDTAYIETVYGNLSGNATSATAANLTTTANAIAYYTNTTGTFGTKASANGALYATAANGALQWGILPVAQGGTGANLGADSSGATRAVVMNPNGTALTTRPLVDSTAHTAFSYTSTSLVTERAIYYALPKINNDHAYDSLSNFYAPTSVGAANQILTSSGSGAPSWTTLPSGGFLSTNANGQLVGRADAGWNIDSPPYPGVFNANSSSTTGTLPITTTHTAACTVFDYGNMNNWIEFYMTQRIGGSTTGSASPRLFQRSCFSSTISDWVEYVQRPLNGAVPVNVGGTGATSFTADSVIVSGSTTTAALTTRAITNNTSNTAATASTNIPTMNTLYYTLAKINNADQTHATSIYAPTAGGTAGRILKAQGATSTPTWSVVTSLTESLGTTTTNGYGGIILGNATASGTVNNAYGFVRLYGSGAKYHNINPAPVASTSNYSHYLPNVTGWIASGGTATAGSEAGVGSTTQPVYLSSAGILTACSTRTQVITYTGTGTDSMSLTFSFAPDIIIVLYPRGKEFVNSTVTHIPQNGWAPAPAYNYVLMSNVTTSYVAIDKNCTSVGMQDGQGLMRQVLKNGTMLRWAYSGTFVGYPVEHKKSSDGTQYFLHINSTINAQFGNLYGPWNIWNETGLVSTFLGIKF